MRKLTLIVLLGLLVLTWGNAFVVIKYLLEQVGLSPMELTALRYVPSAILSAAMLLVLFPVPTILAAWRKHWLGIAVYGATGVLGYNIALNFGEVRIPAGTASLIVGFSPVMTLLAANIFLKERITLRKLAGIVTAFAGLFVVVRWGAGEPISFGYLSAVLITFGAPASWVAYTVVGKPLVSSADPNLVTLSAIIWGSLPLAFFLPPSYSHITANGWLALAFLGVVCTIFGFLVWSWALRFTEAARLGAVVYLIPLVTIVSGIALLGERLTLGLVLGAAILIVGVATAEL